MRSPSSTKDAMQGKAKKPKKEQEPVPEWANDYLPTTLVDANGKEFTRKGPPSFIFDGQVIAAYYNCKYFRKK